MRSFVASTSKWLALALALSWTTACIDAATIKASDVTALSTNLSKFQTLEKTWSVSGPRRLRNLLVQAPGLVFVDYDASLNSNDPDALIAKVVVTGDSEDLINAFTVISWDEPTGEGVKLLFHAPVGSFRGHLLTQIFVGDKQTLQNLKSVSSADVVISDNVLKNNDETASLELSALGSGDVTVLSTQKLFVGTLSVLSVGSGDVEVQASLIEVTKSISVSALGSGDIALVAQEIKAHAVATKAVGSGNVYIQADSVVATTIDALLSGSGDVTFSRGGKCVNQTVRLINSGDFASGSIVSKFADVSVYGSGEALIQATEKLVAIITGSGELHYVANAPKEVVVHGRPSSHRGHGSKKIIKQASRNEFDTYKPAKSRQSRIPPLVVITRSKNHGKERFIFSDDDDSFDESYDHFDNYDNFVKNLAARSPAAGPSHTPMAITGYVGVFMGCVGLVAVYKRHQQRRRAEYSPLIAVTTN